MSLIEEIDDELALLEDTLKGPDGDSITKIRGKIEDYRKLPFNRKVRDLPEVNKHLAWVAKATGHEKKVAEFFKFNKNKQLQLTVTVIDPELLNVILTSEWGPEGSGLMPGAIVSDVRFGDLERKDVVEQWLTKQLNKIQNNE